MAFWEATNFYLMGIFRIYGLRDCVGLSQIFWDFYLMGIFRIYGLRDGVGLSQISQIFWDYYLMGFLGAGWRHLD